MQSDENKANYKEVKKNLKALTKEVRDFAFTISLLVYSVGPRDVDLPPEHRGARADHRPAVRHSPRSLARPVRHSQGIHSQGSGNCQILCTVFPTWSPHHRLIVQVITVTSRLNSNCPSYANLIELREVASKMPEVTKVKIFNSNCLRIDLQYFDIGSARWIKCV